MACGRGDGGRSGSLRRLGQQPITLKKLSFTSGRPEIAALDPQLPNLACRRSSPFAVSQFKTLGTTKELCGKLGDEADQAAW